MSNQRMKKVLIFARLGIMAFCFCCFFAWNPLKAQNESSLEQVPLPLILSKGPLIQQPPAISSWEINYFYASDPKQKSGETPTAALASPSKSPTPGAGLSLLPPRRVTLSYAAPSWHALTINTGGISIEEWFNGNFRAVTAGGLPPRLLRSEHRESPIRSPFVDYGSRKFPECRVPRATSGCFSRLRISRPGSIWKPAFPCNGRKGEKHASSVNFSPLLCRFPSPQKFKDCLPKYSTIGIYFIPRYRVSLSDIRKDAVVYCYQMVH